MEVNDEMSSKIYEWLDVIYFNKMKNNPRRAIIENIPEQEVSILEVGMGTADNLVLVGKQRPNAQVIGIDNSPKMIEISSRKLYKEELANVTVEMMDGTQMTFEDESFDIVVISLALHEVSEATRKKLLKEVRRVLKIKGRLIVVEWVKLQKRWQRAIFKIVELMGPKDFNAFLQIDLPRYIKQYGFSPRRRKYCDYSQVVAFTKR